MTLKRILVAIDFSAASDRALDCARTLADALGASLHLLHVVCDPLAPSTMLTAEQCEICTRLNALLDARDRGARLATVACVAGTPAHEIARYAADHAIDLIVMGTHPHGPTFMMATSSIAERVLGTASCAVLAVAPSEPPPLS